MTEQEKQIAKILLEIKAVHLQPDDPFTWTSGIKSPIYCDNRQIISYPDNRKIIVKAFSDYIKTYFPQTEVIAGTATAGIPWGAWVAEELNLPLVYVRSSSKGHGLQNLIEGRLIDGQKTVLIEDLISTGKSSVAAAKALQESKADVLTTLAIFTYEFEIAKDKFKADNLNFVTLSNLTALLEVAKEISLLTEEQVGEVKSWKETITL
jgi:orotate phosphoribosyltransferase